MTATADQIIERRRIRRRLAFWRVLAIIAILIAVVALMPRMGGSSGPHIARVAVEGMIFNDPAREKLIRDLVENDSAKALIVAIDSPGGTLVGSEALYDAIQKVAAEKPVVAVMSELAASGGYMTAIATDHIVARRNTITGSIGVVMEAPNIVGLLDMLGVEVTRLKSAPLKAEPSFSTRPTPEALAARQDLIDDGFAWFRGLVAERRGLDGLALDRVTDGRVFSGAQAVDLGLIDALGDQEDATNWLAEEREIDPDLPVLEYKTSDDAVPWPLNLFGFSPDTFLQPSRFIDGAPRLYALMQ